MPVSDHGYHVQVVERRFQAGKVSVLCGPVVYALSTKDTPWLDGVDCLRIDVGRSLHKTADGVAVVLKDAYSWYGGQTSTFLPFADETRFQTCFGIIGSSDVAPQTDELLVTGAHSGNDCKVHR